MENELGKQLMKLFFLAPMVEGLLVFEDNEYLGVVLKKDIEKGVVEGAFNFFENINCVRASSVPAMLFKNEPKKNYAIPVLDKAGNLIRVISYEEYLSQFHFDDFINGFKTHLVLDNLDFPFIITNHFKRILYVNKRALEITEHDLLGKSVSQLLKLFEIKSVSPYMLLEKNETTYHIVISHSENRSFSYYVYQFLQF